MRRSTLLVAGAAAVARVATACGGGSGSGASGESILIGATLSLTGDLGGLGQPMEAGYEQEVADVSAAGGIAIGGTQEKLKLVVLNNGSNPNTASSQARELVLHDHAVALLGSTAPLIVTPIALVAEQLHVPFVTSLTPVKAFASGNKDGWKYSWDFFFDEQQQAADAARALASVPSNKKVVLFTDSEPDGVAEQPLYEAALKADGLHVVGDYTFAVGTTDLSKFIAKAKASGALLLAGQIAQADGTALWRQLKSSEYHPQAAFLGPASDADSWWQSLGSTARTPCRRATGARARHRLRSWRRSARPSARSTQAVPATRLQR